MLTEIKTQKERNQHLDKDKYELKILSEKQPWNELIQNFPINNLFIESEKIDWNDIVQEKGRNTLVIAAAEKETLLKQNINLLHKNGLKHLIQKDQI